MMDEIERDDDDTQAAELALRLLDEPELSAAQARLQHDPAFARQVAAWEVRLADLATEVAPQQPASNAKQALMNRLFATPEPAPLLSRLAFWRGLAFASVALAGVLAVMIATGPQQSQQTVFVTEIASSSGDFRVVAVLDWAADELQVTRTRGSAPPGRVLQFWGHGEGEPPMSIGLLPDSDTARLPIPDFLRNRQGTLYFGISEEPPNGSTTGRPSGTVLGTGEIAG